MTTTIYIPVGDAEPMYFIHRDATVIDGIIYKKFEIENEVLEMVVKGLQPESDFKDNFMSDQDEKKKLVDDFLSYQVPSGLDIMQYLNKTGKAPKNAEDWKGEYTLTADEMVEMLSKLQKSFK